LGARALKKQKPNVKTNKGQAQKGQGGQGQERGQGHEEEEEEKDDKEDKKDKDKDEENLFDRDIDPQDPLGHLGVFRTQLAATTSHAKRTELRSLQTRLARTVGKRWMQLEAHALQQTMRALKREILRIDQGAHVVAFDARAAPYVEKYKRALRAAATRTRVPITHTRDTKSKEKRVMVVRVAPPCADAPQTVEALGDALRTELLGEPAPLYIACGDVCDVCGVAMRIVGAHSVWGCPTCGKTRKYDLMTSAAVGHGTEHVSWKRSKTPRARNMQILRKRLHASWHRHSCRVASRRFVLLHFKLRSETKWPSEDHSLTPSTRSSVYKAPFPTLRCV
jgi:hypothetical protein